MMKKILVMAFAAMLLVLVGGSAQASLIQSLDMDTVSIWAVDCYNGSGPGQDNSVVLDSNFYGQGATLQYNDGEGWIPVAANGTISLNMIECKKEVFFRLAENPGNVTYDYSAALTFSGGSDSQCCSLDVYNSVFMDWGGDVGQVELTFISTKGCDKVAPVPVPPSAIMLFSGLLGLVGVRRVRKDS